jgi:ribosome-associated toxin RatA of RatAB toxin-antitoxin module
VTESVRGDIDIEAEAGEILDVILDFTSYPEWSSNVKEVTIEKADDEGRGTLVRYRVDAKVREVTYRLAYEYSDLPASFSWTLEDGDLEELSGSYAFDEFDDVTEVAYEVQIDPGFPVPGVIKRQAEKQIASSALKKLKERVESGK